MKTPSILKTALTLALAALITTSASAQTTQYIPIPADSTTGSARAIAVITVPALPSNVCTTTNGNCYSANSPAPTSGTSGLQGVFAPLKGKSISCSNSWTAVSAYVDNDGNPWVIAGRATSYTAGTHTFWTNGFFSNSVHYESGEVWLTTSGIKGAGSSASNAAVCEAFWS